MGTGPGALGPADGVHLLHTMGGTFALQDSLACGAATALIVGVGYIGPATHRSRCACHPGPTAARRCGRSRGSANCARINTRRPWTGRLRDRLSGTFTRHSTPVSTGESLIVVAALSSLKTTVVGAYGCKMGKTQSLRSWQAGLRNRAGVNVAHAGG